MGLRLAVLLCTGVLLASCGGDGPTGPLPDAQGETLVIAPSALLFGAAGERQQLRAFSVDDDGDSTEVTATFATSSAHAVSVSSDGIATGGAALGSAQIVARSGDLVSAPILALRATPAEGALLVADSQVVGSIEPVDPTGLYQPGWRYRVRLRGATPDVGQIVLATGGAPVGGRVVSASQIGPEVAVVLELVPIGQMFDALQISERLSLEHAELAVPAEVRARFNTSRATNGRLKAEARGGAARFAASRSRAVAGVTGIEQEFDLGPFTCKAEVPAPLTFPLSLDVFSFEVHPTLYLDLEIQDAALRRFVVEGGIAPTITANPLITAALEAKAECKVQLATLILPVGGPLSLLLGGQVPLGVGFEIGAKASIGQIGFDAFLDASVDAAFGIDCAAGCQVVAALDVQGPSGYFKPKLPSLNGDLRFELGASAFGWGELTIGNALLEALRFKAVELKAGLEQKMELATREAQANDPAYASSYALKPVLEAKAAANLQPIANLLSVNLATLTFAPELPTISRSPHGTFTITPATVTPGDGTQLGQQATFTITLSDVTYLGAYAVEGVEIRWRKTSGATVTLEPGRPGCTDLTAAQDQLSFTCQTDFLQTHQGPQTFYAFVKTRIFGVPVPVPLELSNDAKAMITVATSQVSVAPASVTLNVGAQTQFTANVSGLASTAVTWAATGGTINASGNTATYTAGATPGIYSVTATSVADPSQQGTARVEVVPATTPSGTRAVSADGRMDTSVQLPFTLLTPPCDVDRIAPTAIPASLMYAATLECPPLTQTDPQGNIHTGRSESRQSYLVTTTTGTLAGDVVSIEIDGGSSASSAATAGHTVLAEGSSRMSVCFSVPAGASYRWHVTGTLSAAGRSGYASASLTGTTFSRTTSTTLPSTIAVDDTGTLDAGFHCLSVVQVATANSAVGIPTASGDSRYTNIKLRILP